MKGKSLLLGILMSILILVGVLFLSGATTHQAILTWTASVVSTGQPAISGYNVYRGGTSGGPYAKLNSALVVCCTYTDTTVTAGGTYYYVATASDVNGNESTFSNQVSGVIPANPNPPTTLTITVK